MPSTRRNDVGPASGSPVRKNTAEGDLQAREGRYDTMTHDNSQTGWNPLMSFVGGVVLAGLLLGHANTPGGWYAALNKPGFNPPSYLFAPVWLALYVCIGIGGARTWSRSPRSPAMGAWVVQMALNFLWSPIFFGMHRIGLALGIMAALLMSIVAFIALQWSADRLVAFLFVPYAAWVAFAFALNWSIYWLN